MPQGKNQETVGIMADPEFQKLPPDVQQRVLALAQGQEPSAPKPKFFEPGGTLEEFVGPAKPSISDILVGPGAPLLHLLKKGFRSVQSPLESVEQRLSRAEERGEVRPSAISHFPFQALKSTARVGESLADPSTALMGAAALHPLGRLAVGTYMVGTGAKSTLTPRQEGEDVADYIERVLLGASGIAAGAAGIKSGGLRTPQQLLEQRLNRATYAAGSAPGVNEAFRATIADLDQTARAGNIRIHTVADVSKLVDSTLNRFNTHFELAMQPYAGDQLVPTQVANDLRAAADKLPPTARTEANYIRNYATKFERPWSLRDLQKEWIYRNKLWRGMAGKTELGQAAAKANATTAITDVVRGSARDVVVDYLESKYPGQGFRDLKLRQSELLTLKDQLEPHVSKLRGQQAGRKGGPMREMAHGRGVVSRHGIRAYLSVPEQLRRGPETVANVAAKKAFKKLGPGRELRPLVRPAGGAGGGAARGGGGAGGPQVIPPAGRSPGTPRYNYRGPVVEAESDIEQARRLRAAPSTALVKTSPSHPERGTYIREEPRLGFGTAKSEEALQRQLDVAKRGGHGEWATRVMNKMQQAQAQGTDTAHFQAALDEIAPGRKFHELPPREMSRVIRRAQQLKKAAQGGK